MMMINTRNMILVKKLCNNKNLYCKSFNYIQWIKNTCMIYVIKVLFFFVKQNINLTTTRPKNQEKNELSGITYETITANEQIKNSKTIVQRYRILIHTKMRKTNKKFSNGRLLLIHTDYDYVYQWFFEMIRNEYQREAFIFTQ